MGVSWVELPADAPEPGPLSIVADKFGMHWCRIREATYAERWAGVSGENAGDLTSWEGIERPLDLYVPDGGEPPTADREERDASAHAAYLAATDAQRRAAEMQVEAWPRYLASVERLAEAACAPAMTPEERREQLARDLDVLHKTGRKRFLI